jgi:hypothetical protein
MSSSNMQQSSITEFLVTPKIKTNKSKTKIDNILIEFIETPSDKSDIDYKNIREPYKNSEFIPLSSIQSILAHHFGSTSEKIHAFAENHLLLKIKICDILNAPINNWSYNRPPDMSRCPDIARYIYNSKKPIDTMIYLTYMNKTDTFEVLDGIHRLTALRIIQTENSKSKPLDFITPPNEGEYEFGSNNDAHWLYDQYLLVNIRFNSVLGDLIEIFKTLNKSQAVPDIYIRDIAKEKRDIIEAVANDWQIRYKKHFSSSAKPIIGNTNRNSFINLLDVIYDKYKIDDTKINKFKQILEEANAKISLNIPLKFSVDTRLKCRESGCYLFLYKNDKLEELI